MLTKREQKLLILIFAISFIALVVGVNILNTGIQVGNTIMNILLGLILAVTIVCSFIAIIASVSLTLYNFVFKILQKKKQGKNQQDIKKLSEEFTEVHLKDDSMVKDFLDKANIKYKSIARIDEDGMVFYVLKAEIHVYCEGKTNYETFTERFIV